MLLARSRARLSALALCAALTSPFDAVRAAPPDSEAPTVPGNLRAVVLQSTGITLSWDASSDNRRVRSYRVTRDGEAVGSTGGTTYAVDALTPSTSYTLAVVASDGQNESAPATILATTAAGDPDAPVEQRPGKGKGRKGGGTEEPPVEEPPTPPGGAPADWNLVFGDEFDGSGDIAVGQPDSLWMFEDLHDALNRSGNSGMDELGNADVPSWQSPKGKRWSAWYDAYQTDNAYRSGGLLVMQGLSSGLSDPTRQDQYFDEGSSIDYGSSKLYTAWLHTWGRVWDQSLGKHVVDPASPGRSFRYGYFETRLSFAEMVTPGFRLSMWLMPASSDAEGQELVVSNAYDANGDDGVEIDIFEYEFVAGEHEQQLQLSLHGGLAGSDADTFDASTVGIDLRSGFHTIGFLWEAERLVWTIDGIVVKTVTDTVLIPDVYSYLILSREMNSGVKRESSDGLNPGDPIEVLPYRPRDPGLYGKNVWAYRDRLATDRALIDHVRVWQP